MTTVLTQPVATISDHGAQSGLGDDDHAQYLLLAGRAGGQTAIGGTLASQTLTLRGSSNANLGRIITQSPINQEDDWSPAAGLSPYYIRDNSNWGTYTASFIGGTYADLKTITFTNAVFVYEVMRGTPVLTKQVNDGFAAFTMFNALPVLASGTGAGHNPLSALYLNCGGSIQHLNTGTRTTTNAVAVNFAVTLNTRASNGQTLNITNTTGLSLNPKWNTNAGTTANFGTIRGIHCQSPAQAPFGGSSAGFETMAGYYGIDFDNITFSTSQKAVVRSAMTDAATRFFLLNNGGARSDFGGGSLLDCGQIQIDADSVGLVLGEGQDVDINWNGTALEFDPLSGDDLRLTFGSNFHTFQSQDFGTDSEIRWGFDRFAFGQTGAVGNQVGVFAAPARSTLINGEWADYLLTQAGNLTVNDTMNAIYAWVINAVSLTSGTGSLTGPIATLNIGGMTTSGIGSNPTAAIRSTGRLWQRGVVRFETTSLAQITSDQDDYDLSLNTNSGRFWNLISSDAARAITGIVAGNDGDTVRLTNEGSFNITLNHQDAGSAAANQFLFSTGANIILAPDASITIGYDGSNWRDV